MEYNEADRSLTFVKAGLISYFSSSKSGLTIGILSGSGYIFHRTKNLPNGSVGNSRTIAPRGMDKNPTMIEIPQSRP